MKKVYRVKSDREFQRVFEEGTSFANRQFVVYTLKKEGQQHFRVGFSVSKKLGNAVRRNHIKRYMRESIYDLSNHIHPAYDLIVIARRDAVNQPLPTLKQNMYHVLRLAQVLKEN
ncbi:ribonuclease P protein component [Atopobacter phocae]|uniref:ribonuclease P protein component n=1 Tax=Atopobacter phocae TaxID=136492 RepID=UPI00047203BF|nr:ribonuclease P protein component [Atopobacter phocae]